MADAVSISIPELPQAQRRLAKLPKELHAEALNSAVKFLLSERGLGWYPRRRSVTRKRAYGKTFFTDRQRRWFWWALRSGKISVPYRRTMGMRKAWNVVGSGDSIRLVNATRAAVYTIGNQTQSAHERLVGWHTVNRRFKETSRQMDKALQRGAKAAMKKAGYK